MRVSALTLKLSMLVSGLCKGNDQFTVFFTDEKQKQKKVHLPVPGIKKNKK